MVRLGVFLRLLTAVGLADFVLFHEYWQVENEGQNEQSPTNFHFDLERPFVVSVLQHSKGLKSQKNFPKMFIIVQIVRVHETMEKFKSKPKNLFIYLFLAP